MASNISKHSFQWADLDVADDELLTRTFIIHVFGLEVRCLAVCSTGYTKSGRREQKISYELAWDDCEYKPLLYSGEVNVRNDGSLMWFDKKPSGQQSHVSSSVEFPKGAVTLRANSGTMTVDFSFEFGLGGAAGMSDIMPLLEEKVLTDVVVVCGERTFDCHKAILAARSKVFKTMLTGPFKEASENKIDLGVSKG
jgi:hypothetical protein